MVRGSGPRGLPPSPPTHECCFRLHRSWRRQPHHEAGARNRRLAVIPDGACAVFGPDAAAMGFDDLLGDRESKTGILAEALVRPVGIEALENPLQRVGADARSVVIDHDLDPRPDTAAQDAYLAPGGGKR